jgi:UDP-N-acetylmuramoyl-tripeptide--D-alanyl-D-alanine ligase
MAVGLHVGVPVEAAVAAIEGYVPVNGRSQLVETGRNTVYLDAYNANPGSMAAAIEAIAGLPVENKVLVLGEMLELGEHAARAHAGLLARVEELGFREVFLVGRAFEPVEEWCSFARRFRDAGELGGFLRDHPVRSSFVLVKGSRGNQLEQIVEYL